MKPKQHTFLKYEKQYHNFARKTQFLNLGLGVHIGTSTLRGEGESGWVK